MMPWPAFVALILLDIASLAAALVLTKWRPYHHTLMGLLFGAGIIVTVLVVADQLVALLRYRQPDGLRIVGIFGAVLYLQIKLYRGRARSSFRYSVWDVAQRRWRPGRPFTAALAPIGVPANDGRPGLMAAEWSVRTGGAPVTIDDPANPHHPLVIGRLDQVWLGQMAPLMLYGAGVIMHGVKLGTLRPAVEILPGGQPAAPHPELPAMFPAGQILGVRMDDRPAFHGVWLRYVEGRTN
jgi:hypothetical protein